MYYQNIEGWFDFQNLYCDLVSNKLGEDSTFVEIGSWKGKSICYFAELCKELNKNINIFSVDIFSDKLDDINNPYKVKLGQFNCYNEFLFNLSKANVIDVVRSLVLFSSDAAELFCDESVDCVFIDGAHDEKSITTDLTKWVPKVKRGGYVCGHDYINIVKPYVDKYFYNNFQSKVEIVPLYSFMWKKP